MAAVTLADARRLVVKIGSALLVDRDTGALRSDWLRSLADDVARIKARGVDVVLVSSGAIAAVMGAYLWIFPKAKLLQIVPIVYIQLKIPAWVYVLLWMVAQAVFGFFSDAMGTAWFSHLFGAIFGLAMTPWVLRRRRAEVSERVRFRSARAIFGDRLAKRPDPSQAAAAPPPTPTTFGIPKASTSQSGKTPSASGSFTQAGAPTTRGQGFSRRTREQGEPPRSGEGG